MIFTLIFGLFALVVLVTKIHHYLAQVPCTSTASLVGKTALVTGGSCGELGVFDFLFLNMLI